jgi:hypothetical protein
MPQAHAPLKIFPAREETQEIQRNEHWLEKFKKDFSYPLARFLRLYFAIYFSYALSYY